VVVGAGVVVVVVALCVVLVVAGAAQEVAPGEENFPDSQGTHGGASLK